jgi:hypothetical protein
MLKFKDVVVPRGIEVGVKLIVKTGGDTAQADGHSARLHASASNSFDKRNDPAAALRISVPSPETVLCLIDLQTVYA